jgi:hypothetical protein
MMESFLAKLKTEQADSGQFHRLQEAKISAFSFVEAICSRKRRLSSLGSLSVDEYENLMNVSSLGVHL